MPRDITESRQVLGAFLRARRERLTAHEGGLAGFRRRRTPGLKREEVAQACGMSATWYSWIEQGRDVSVSPSALAGLASALHLTRAERAYLFELAGKRDPTDEPTNAGPTEDQRPFIPLVNAVAGPAYVLDRLWRACAFNGAALRHFPAWLGGSEPCLLAYVFLDPSARDFIADWADRARRLAAEFRADTARRHGDAAFDALLDRLRRQSPEFEAFWQDHAVLEREGGQRAFVHPDSGPVVYNQITLVPIGFPDHKVVLLLPA